MIKPRFVSDKQISDWLEIKLMGEHEGVILLDGLYSACLGVTQADPYRLIYDEEAIVDVLIHQGMAADEAYEYYEFNIAGLGIDDEHAPLLIRGPLRYELDELK